MIKKILAVVAVIVVASAIGIVSADQYQKYQTKHTPEATVTVAQKDRAVESVKVAAAGEYNALKASYDALQVECEKGLAAYNALPVASKAKTSQPQCSPAVAR